MKKILIIGSGGAGKSTLARRLHEATGIELIHLDQIYWLPNWTEPSKNDWIKTNEKLLEKDALIMDGTFGSTLEMRLNECDTVLFLDIPRTVCIYRAVKRLLKYRGENRPDMGAGCVEKFDFEFLKWIWNFPKKDKLRIEKYLEKHTGNVKIIRLKSSREIKNFLSEIITERI